MSKWVLKHIDQQCSAIVNHYNVGYIKSSKLSPLALTYALSANHHWSIAWSMTVYWCLINSSTSCTGCWQAVVALPRFCNPQTKVWNVHRPRLGATMKSGDWWQSNSSTVAFIYWSMRRNRLDETIAKIKRFAPHMTETSHYCTCEKHLNILNRVGVTRSWGWKADRGTLRQTFWSKCRAT